MINNTKIESAINSPVRTIKARVEVYNASTLLYTFNPEDRLIEFSIERDSEEGLFFGFGICQKLNVKIIDKEKAIAVTPANTVKIAFGAGGQWIYPLPEFNITQSRRDERTNALTIYGYDAIFKTSAMTTGELGLVAPYTIEDLAKKCAEKMGLTGVSIQRLGAQETCFSLNYPEGANIEGSESIRDILNDIAEATQTIYFINAGKQLVFKRLSKAAPVDFTISKARYFDLESRENKRLAEIASVTELGDNLSAKIEQSGTTQYIKENVLWDLREDRAQLVNNALAAVGGLTINQFSCEWRGDFLVELGDKLGLEGKDGKSLTSFILSDTIEYNGTLQQKTEWKYNENTTESDSNSTSLGDTLKQTFAKVDKANKKVEIVASDVKASSEKVGSLEVNIDGINASIKEVADNAQDGIDGANEEIRKVSNRVDAKMDSEGLELRVQKAITDGDIKVDAVSGTGFKFDATGLTIDKTDSKVQTNINNDGMKISREGEEMLIADQAGVQAKNLHATTYLIIGDNSRAENYGYDRTGVYWIK